MDCAPCREPGCPRVPYAGGYCATHARAHGLLPATVMCAFCHYENQVLPGTDRCDRCTVEPAAPPKQQDLTLTAQLDAESVAAAGKGRTR